MTGFVVVVDSHGQEHIINTRWIEEVWPCGNDSCDIHFAFIWGDAVEPDCIHLAFGYEQLKKELVVG